MIKYNTLADKKDPAHIRDGAPGTVIGASYKVPDDYVLTQEDLAAGFKLASDQEFSVINAQSIADWELWDKNQSPYEVSDLFSRLTAAERTAIRSGNDNVRDAWERILSAGKLQCPPDGKTRERKISQVAYNLCKNLFGQARADEIFSR